ncbi:MAG: hypothetical protein GKR97_20570 [Rhizobiaceae bacterium]|nr:hypothetical protein [Rhizobiaceae bacterium]
MVSLYNSKVKRPALGKLERSIDKGLYRLSASQKVNISTINTAEVQGRFTQQQKLKSLIIRNYSATLFLLPLGATI